MSDAPPHPAPELLVEASSMDSLSDASAAQGARRLGITAASAAGVFAVYTVLYRTVWVRESNAVGTIAGIVGGLISGGVAYYLLSGARPLRQVVRAGLGYEVFISFALAMSEAWSAPYRVPTAQVSWVAVLIVLFPFLVPAKPRPMLVTSIMAAATVPLAMALFFSAPGRSWPEPRVITSYVIPPIFCAFLAWVPTSVLSQLAADVRAARRLGNYELLDRLGAGGMGEVWSARHRLLARPAAVKLIKPDVLGAKDASSRAAIIRRFEREAQVTASLESPHTIELYDFGISKEGTLFYVMELLRGVDLETLVERFGPLPAERVVHLLMQACDSLDDAHERGLIHRDVKPANLFVCRRGAAADFVKLLDFGLVKRWEAREDEPSLTAPAHAALSQTGIGQLVGTPAYLPPEAALGEGAVDRRADLYSLGCVAYFLLTGQLVFQETSVMAMAVAHVTREPEPPSARTQLAIPPELEALVMSCLHKDRTQRPATAAELRLRLAGVPLSAPWTRERAAAWWKQHLS